MTFYARTQRLIAELKTRLADLEDEWERLDSQGTGTERQREIADEMLRVAAEISGFEQLLTRLRNR